MTPARAADIGFEIMKLYQLPHCYFWLADIGWEGGFEALATREEEGIAVRTQYVPTMILAAPTGAN